MNLHANGVYIAIVRMLMSSDVGSRDIMPFQYTAALVLVNRHNHFAMFFWFLLRGARLLIVCTIYILASCLDDERPQNPTTDVSALHYQKNDHSQVGKNLGLVTVQSM